ncbi:MAG: zinc ribbon domain-containing protein [Anaerolineales bacterium]
MNAIDIIEEFQNRSKTARGYREAAALLLVIAIVLFTLYAIYRAPIGAWGGAVLAAGVAVGVATIGLTAVSYLKLRCPNCGRVLGEVHDAAYCPSCGAALKSDGITGMDAAGPPKRKGSGRAMARRAAAGTSIGRAWEPRSGTPGIDDFPEEAYPKNIRMFTTPNEMELTKRYIHLIDRDNSGGPAPTRMIGRGSRTARNILPEKIPGGKPEKPAVRRPHGIIGAFSLESIIAIAAGIIILAGILIVVINALR